MYKACKIDKYSDTKKCSCEKRLMGKLVLACEDEILNATEKSRSHIHMISLVIISWILLAAVSVGCYCCYRRDQIKEENIASY